MKDWGKSRKRGRWGWGRSRRRSRERRRRRNGEGDGEEKERREIVKWNGGTGGKRGGRELGEEKWEGGGIEENEDGGGVGGEG